MALTRTFEIDGQHWFAAASGDSNPIHVDPQWATTHFPGALVVHGVHVLLWALDELVTQRRDTFLASIDATFVKPVLIGDEVELSFLDNGRLVRVTVRGDTAMVARIGFGSGHGDGDRRFKAGPILTNPRTRPASEFAQLAGTIALPHAATGLATRFTALAAAIGNDRLIGLAAMSTLVGMECPGLRSMLSRVTVTAAPAESEHLGFRVRKFHDAMSLVEIDVHGLGFEGTVSAFAGREPPVAAPEALCSMVSSSEFSGQRPLIVGAASGLGATTAKLLAAGGADPLLTWHTSAPDETVLAVRSLGASGQTVRLDAASPSQGLTDLAAFGWNGHQLYYFATPRIFRRRIEPYQAADFADFRAIFVDGFYDIVRHLVRLKFGPLTVFYPSTVAIDEPATDLLEYTFAKTMGEQLCARMEKTMPGIKTIVARLPRVTTRQTETFLKVKAETPEAVMLPLIRAVQSA